MTDNLPVEKKKQEVTELGDGQVFIKYTPKGRIQAVKARVRLREDAGDLTIIEGKPQITADGYYRANAITSLGIITPDSIKIPDPSGNMGALDVPNPYPLMDQKSGTQKGVYVKKIVVGYSPTGTLAISSNTMFYNYTTYFLQDLHKKITTNKNAGRLCFEAQLTEEEKQKGIFMPIEGLLGIWADMNHADVLKCVSTWLQNKNFGERKAQTICERNALKHHPSLAVPIKSLEGPEKHRTAYIDIVGWQHDYNWKELQDVAMAADRGDEIEINGKKVEVVNTTGDVTEDDLRASDEVDDVENVPNSDVTSSQHGKLF